MKPLNQKLFLVIVAVTALAGSVAAPQVVVTGTGDPHVDVPA